MDHVAQSQSERTVKAWRGGEGAGVWNDDVEICDLGPDAHRGGRRRHAGIGHRLQTKNPTIVSAFPSSLDHQMLIVALICAVLALD